MPVLKSVKRAALVCADALSRVSLPPILKAHGIKDKRYGARLIQKLRTQFSLDPAPRSGRPPKYSEAQLVAAEAALASPAHPYHSGDVLMAELKEQAVLPEEAKKRGFLPRVKGFMRLAGRRLAFGGRSKQQALTTADSKQRLAWCKEMQHVITDTTVVDWWFADEKWLGGRGKFLGE